MSGQNIPLAAYLSPLYSGQVQEVFKENKWPVTDVMKAGLELFLSCPKSLQDELVKRQTGQKDHVSIDDLVTVMKAMPTKVRPRYDVKKAQGERGPQKKEEWICPICHKVHKQKPAPKTTLQPEVI